MLIGRKPSGDRAWNWQTCARPLAEPQAGPRLWLLFGSKLAIGFFFSGFALFAELPRACGAAQARDCDMKRVALLVGVVAAIVVLSKLLIENVMGLTIGEAAEQWLSRAGAASGLTIVALLGADIFLPIPSSLVMILSGAAFGVTGGSLLSFVGSVGGEWLGFELVRRYGRRASILVVSDEEMARLERLFDRFGFEVVIATRALPVAMETLSVVAAMSGMKRTRFLLASLIGTAPVVVVYAYAGAVSRQVGNVVPAMVILIAVAVCGWVWLRARTDPSG